MKRQVQNNFTENVRTCKNGVGVTTFMHAWNLFIAENIIEMLLHIPTNLTKEKHQCIIDHVIANRLML